MRRLCVKFFVLYPKRPFWFYDKNIYRSTYGLNNARIVHRLNCHINCILSKVNGILQCEKFPRNLRFPQRDFLSVLITHISILNYFR